MARRSFSLGITAVVLLLIPTLFVFKISPSAAPVGAQELRPKQEYVTGQGPAEAPRKSPNRLATNQAAKPVGKMGFVPASPSSNQRTTVARPESVANPVARRAVAQPPKYAVSADAAPEAPQTQTPATRPVVSRPARTQSPLQPTAVANQPPKQIPASRQFERPQPAVEPLELPDETSEPVIATSRSQPTRTLQKPTLAEPPLDESKMEPPASEKRPSKGVVQLFFDDEPAEGDSNETMELDQPSIATTQPSEILPVAAQGDTTQETARTSAAATAEEIAMQEKTNKECEKRNHIARILADLQPVTKIDLRDSVNLPEFRETTDEGKVEVKDETCKPLPPPSKMAALAMQVPEIGKDDSGDFNKPTDIGLAMLSLRKPFNVFAIARDPWQANRDSHPFYHNPLWFEDPNLERCGRGWGPLTTTVSAMHFAANVPILPYRFTAEKPWTCVRSLPDCTSCEKFGYEAYLPPWSLSAAAVQAAATVGFFYAIP